MPKPTVEEAESVTRTISRMAEEVDALARQLMELRQILVEAKERNDKICAILKELDGVK